VQLASDSSGAALTFARTATKLYQAENNGLTWVTVNQLGATPTALAVSDAQPATVYVGTTDRGLLKSTDGRTWDPANNGLGMLPGVRLQVDALATDPAQPTVLYVATSYLYGSTTLHQSPVGVAMSTNGAHHWLTLHADDKAVVADLLPVTGQTGALFALTTHSRTPLALGQAAFLAAHTTANTPTTNTAVAFDSEIISWCIAVLAALALIFAILDDLRNRRAAHQSLAAASLRP
jgi:hypothetical protein